MSSKLDQVTDWASLAKGASYKATFLAHSCEMSVRQLTRYFLEKKKCTPHKWLHELRMQRAVELVCDKTPLKVVSIELGYKDPAHFTHDFTNYFGMPPSKFAGRQPELNIPTRNVRF
jgi:transcriptional regulator GlxA family with amidase domain